MSRKVRRTRQDELAVTVDQCRVRVQTGEPIVFIDARKTEDRAASNIQIAGSIRFAADDRAAHPPCHKHNYIVVYCA